MKVSNAALAFLVTGLLIGWFVTSTILRSGAVGATESEAYCQHLDPNATAIFTPRWAVTIRGTVQEITHGPLSGNTSREDSITYLDNTNEVRMCRIHAAVLEHSGVPNFHANDHIQWDHGKGVVTGTQFQLLIDTATPTDFLSAHAF